MTKISKIKVQGVTHEIKDNEAYVKPSSGIPASDIAEGVIPDISGKQDTLVSGENIKTINNQSILGEGNLVVEGPDVSGKADKVSNATSGNFAALDSEGNLTDSGHKHSDYLTEHQDISGKQDVITDLDTIRSGATAGATAYQKPSTGIPASDLSSAVQTSLGKADTALQSFTETDPTVPNWAKQSDKPSYTKSEVGLGNVTNDAQVKRTEMGAASGVATLGTDGKVPASQLPSYVDDVLEYDSSSDFPSTGESGKIYVAKDTNKTYRWSGTGYVEISPSIVIGTTTGTAYDGASGQSLANKLAGIESGAQVHRAPTTDEVKSALGTGSGTTKYLCEDGSWATPPDTNTWRPLGTTADTACAGNDSRLSDARPASDVYSWAKASSKPSYTASEVGLGNVGNFKAVSTVASQGLSSTEQANARANIGAGTVTSIAAGTGLSGGTITDSGTISLNPASNSTIGGIKVDSVLPSNQQVMPVGWPSDIAMGAYFLNLEGSTNRAYIKIPNSFPASDVLAWAKAATKPSYNFSEIGGTVADSQLPDTISSDITGTAMGLKTEKLTDQEFVYRATPNTINAKSLTLDRIYGKTLAWNQLAAIKAQTLEASSQFDAQTQLVPLVVGHKYYISAVFSGVNTTIGFGLGHPGYFSSQGVYVQFSVNGIQSFVGTFEEVSGSSSTHLLIFMLMASASVEVTADDLMCIDLTLLYGTEIDGMTDEEILAKFESEFPGYHDYSAGKLISNDASGIETVGRNLLDEEWEVGKINSTDGMTTTDSTRIRSKNFIPILGGRTYYLKNGGSGTVWVFTYDANKNYITYYSANNAEFTPAANVAFIKICPDATYGTTYGKNICINFSDASFDGQYEPYKKSVLPLNLDNLRVKSPNIWDEEWEVGDIAGDGSYIAKTTVFRSKNNIPVIGGTQYYFGIGVEIIHFYDSANTHIGFDAIYSNRVYALPSNCSSIKFTSTEAYGPTYNNDITINKSDPAFNGKYYPSGILTLTDGVKSAEGVCDEIVGGKFYRRLNKINMANLSWYAKDVYLRYHAGISDMKMAVNHAVKGNIVCSKYLNIDIDHVNQVDMTIGVNDNTRDVYLRDDSLSSVSQIVGELVYELENVEVYDLAEPLVLTIPAGTTERRLPEDTSSSVSAPFCADIQYGVNPGDIANDLIGLNKNIDVVRDAIKDYPDSFLVLAEHVAQLTEEVANIRALSNTKDNLTATKIDVREGFYYNGDKTVLNGAGAPSMVPGFIGQFYVDTTNKKLYVATGNSSSSDWTILN